MFHRDNKEKYNILLNLYKGLSDKYNLHYRQINGGAIRITEKDNVLPWPGINVHALLSSKIYDVLMNKDFQQMMINREIDGIEIRESYNYKQVIFYIPFQLIQSYKKLLNIFRNNGIHIKPKLKVHRTNHGSLVLLNRMYIAKDIFVRYSTGLTTEMSDEKIRDSTWRFAAAHGSPKIWALSRDYLLQHLYKLNYKDDSKIYTFLTLINYHGIITPIPSIILSLSSNKLITYDIKERRRFEYDLSNKNDTNFIVDHPEQRLRAFLI